MKPMVVKRIVGAGYVLVLGFNPKTRNLRDNKIIELLRIS